MHRKQKAAGGTQPPPGDDLDFDGALKQRMAACAPQTMRHIVDTIHDASAVLRYWVPRPGEPLGALPACLLCTPCCLLGVLCRLLLPACASCQPVVLPVASCLLLPNRY